MFNPNIQNFNTKILYKSLKMVNVNGSKKPEYDNLYSTACLWKSMGGTEKTQGSVITYEDTAQVTTWYDPNIKKGDQVLLNEDANQSYEIISIPENIEMRNKIMMFKVKKIGPGD